MKRRTFVAIAALLAAVAALILLTVTVTATTTGGATVACGNAFKTDMSKAAHDSNVNQLTNAMAADRGLGWTMRDTAAGYQVACEGALATRRGIGWGLLAVAGLVLLGALVVRRPAQAGPPPAAAA